MNTTFVYCLMWPKNLVPLMKTGVHGSDSRVNRGVMMQNHRMECQSLGRAAN